MKRKGTTFVPLKGRGWVAIPSSDPEIVLNLDSNDLEPVPMSDHEQQINLGQESNMERNHIHSIKQMTAQNRAIFLDRLVWWEYKTQTNQIVDRIIKKSQKCFKDLELYRLFNFKDFQISKEKPVDFININQSNLNETQISILSKIESISYDYETQKIFMSQKVRN
jgi:hypothetical protein